MISWFQNLLFKCNLYRYIEAETSSAAAPRAPLSFGAPSSPSSSERPSSAAAVHMAAAAFLGGGGARGGSQGGVAGGGGTQRGLGSSPLGAAGGPGLTSRLMDADSRTASMLAQLRDENDTLRAELGAAGQL